MTSTKENILLHRVLNYSIKELLTFNSKYSIYYKKYSGDDVSYYIISSTGKVSLHYESRNVIWFIIDKAKYKWKVLHEGDGKNNSDVNVWIKYPTFDKEGGKYKCELDKNNNYRILHHFPIKFLLHRNGG